MTRRKKTTREKELARSAERRYAERKSHHRKRIAIVVAAVVGVGAVGLVVFQATREKPKSKTEASSAVACGGSVPEGVGVPKPKFEKAPDPNEVLDPQTGYSATIATSCGTFDVDLEAERAPKAVASFVFLANEGFFNGLTFHRIVDGFMIQGGDPKGDGTGGPGYEFATEIDPGLRFGKPGVLAMANSGLDTNGSQWFVTLAPDTELNPTDSASYTIFGHVTEGMETVDEIGLLPTTGLEGSEQSTPTKPVYIESVTIHTS